MISKRLILNIYALYRKVSVGGELSFHIGETKNPHQFLPAITVTKKLAVQYTNNKPNNIPTHQQINIKIQHTNTPLPSPKTYPSTQNFLF